VKITRYFQSCLLVEEGGVRILIDPSGHEAANLDKLGRLDAVLYTHEHGDHFDADMAQTFVEQGIAPVYSNASTAKLIKASGTVVKDGQEFKVGSVSVKALELPHCLMWDGSKGPQNTGFLINKKLFHSGDGKEISGLSVEILAVPITGPDVSLKDAFDFCKQVSAKNVVPVHYDYLGGNPQVFADVGKGMGLSVHPLNAGESINL
jgi:L-ascorbate metabolism protein UlaG (beta-lactamase superfamily)